MIFNFVEFDSWMRSIDKKMNTRDTEVYTEVHDESFLRYDKVQEPKTMSALTNHISQMEQW